MVLSIVTINYNNKLGLEKTVESILSQTCNNFEYIIIDGGSTDGSLDFIQSQKEHISCYVSEKDNGIYDAVNKGIIKSTGKYLMFLNSGDCLSDKNVIKICYEQIERFPNSDIFYGDIFGHLNNSSDKWLHRHPTVLDLFFLKDQNINHQSSLISAGIFNEFGLYPENYRLAGDHWLYLKSFVSGKAFKHIDYPLVIFDYTGTSSTNREKYLNEMETIWNIEVPPYLQKMVKEQYEQKLKLNKKMFRTAHWLDNKIQYIKRGIARLSKQ